MDSTIEVFKSGCQNLLSNEIIPQDAAQDELGYITQDGRMKLVPGRIIKGNDLGVTGLIRGLHFGVKIDASLVLYRKTETTLDYYDSGSDSWVNILTGLTSGSEASFADYSSLSGNFVFFGNVDGLWKINNANPGSAIKLTDPLRNFIGNFFIDKGRMILWNKSIFGKTNSSDPTGLYGSRIDPQTGSVYRTVTGEQAGSSGSAAYSGTLVKMTNLTFTVTIANPAVFTLNNHGFASGQGIVLATTGALPSGLTAGTTYWVMPIDANTFNLSATPPSVGSLVALTTTGSQSGTHSVVATTRNMFGLTISATVGGQTETFTDDFLGNLKSNLGSVGTINYATGAFSLTFSGTTSSNPTASYQYEDSNQGGVTDFTSDGTRLSAQGFVERQDHGGDPIMIVVIGQDGNYYSLKQFSAYQLTISADDKTFTNQIYYEQMGIPSRNACVATSKGIIFLNTNNPDKPEMTILQKNLVTSTLLPAVIFPGFKFANYDFSDSYFDTYERYIVVSCKTFGAAQNNRILLCNISDNTVDVAPYEARMFAKDTVANIYVGSPITQNVYQIFSGFDDLGNAINNFWMGSADQYGNLKSRSLRWRMIREQLKKFRYYKLKGNIALSQVVQVYISYDDAAFQLIGTILGSGSYVNRASPDTIGSNYIGQQQIGGAAIANTYPYFAELKMKNQPKFRKRTIKLVATGIGYFDFAFASDFDIMLFENRLPAAFRSKQRVSLDGTLTDQYP